MYVHRLFEHEREKKIEYSIRDDSLERQPRFHI